MHNRTRCKDDGLVQAKGSEAAGPAQKANSTTKSAPGAAPAIAKAASSTNGAAQPAAKPSASADGASEAATSKKVFCNQVPSVDCFGMIACHDESLTAAGAALSLRTFCPLGAKQPLTLAWEAAGQGSKKGGGWLGQGSASCQGC